MTTQAKKNATYEDLRKYPEGTNAELIDGEIRVAPRPNRGHRLATLKLGSKLSSGIDDGAIKTKWIIEVEPDVKCGKNILVPDLAGWRSERLPDISNTDTLVTVTPDWTCEIVSPSSGRMDRVEKFRIYLETGIQHYWIVDPFNKTLESFKNEGTAWNRIGAWGADDKTRIPPFEDIVIDLSALWMKS